MDKTWMFASLTRNVVVTVLSLLLMPPSGPLAAEPDPWPSLKTDIFGDREVIERDGLLSLYAPERATDATTVPISIRFPPGRANDVKALYLIVDRNPSPIAATIRFGEAFGASPQLGERMFETRLRIDTFAQMRAIAETKDGKLHMANQFVYGTGGCSGPGAKAPEEALAQLGAVKVTQHVNETRGESWREGVVAIRHPNFTGMQLNPKTRAYTPLRIVNAIEVKTGGDLLFRVEGGISISEDPQFRFNYESHASALLEVTATDTEGIKMSGRSAIPGS